MVRILLICLFAAATGLVQTSLAQSKGTGAKAASSPVSPQKPAAPAPKAPEAGPQTAPAPNEPVITIHGLCQDASGPKEACTMTVTKEQFDKLVQALNQNNQAIDPAMRRNLGQAYVDLLVRADAGEKAGIEKTETYREVMQLMRLRTLSDLYQRSLEQQFGNPPPEEVAAYYEAHRADYEQLKLQRVYIPKIDPSGKLTSLEQQAAFAQKAEEVAAEAEARIAKGDAPEQVQKDSYSALGISSAPPSTGMGASRRGALPAADEQHLLALKDGGAYKAQQANTFLIYRLDGRQTIPLESVKGEIARTIFRGKLDAKMKEINSSVHADFNEAYFGPPSTGVAPLNPPVKP
ncbi:MAG: hypothetical protein LAO20_20535 [Acidobacteriia bacterium]|nr:hypothetical protein [Terriglobia bacterium]